MISKELIDKYDIKKAWRSSQKDDTMMIGFRSAYLCECVDGKWLVSFDKTAGASEVLKFNTRATAMKQLRKEGYWTRVSKVKQC